MIRAEIIVNGLVQGVGFRYFVYRQAQRLGLKGFVKNLYTGEVFIVAEGEELNVEELFGLVKIGPSSAHVTKFRIDKTPYKGEFEQFQIKH